MPISTHDRNVYEFALSHLEIRKTEVEVLIAHVRSQTGTAKAVSVDPTMPEWVMTAAERAATQKPVKKAVRKKRTMSAEGKARLIAALKKRWAAHHKAQATTEASEPVTASKKASKKKTMSPEARAKVAAAQKKRWAAFHKAQAAAETPTVKKAAAKKK